MQDEKCPEGCIMKKFLVSCLQERLINHIFSSPMSIFDEKDSKGQKLNLRGSVHRWYNAKSVAHESATDKFFVERVKVHLVFLQ